MTRDKAIRTMDTLTKAGYSVNLSAHAIPDHVGPDIHDGVRYSVSIAEFSMDKMDVRKLMEIADELDLDVGFSPVRGMGSFSFGEPDRRPEILKTQRRHPR